MLNRLLMLSTILTTMLAVFACSDNAIRLPVDPVSHHFIGTGEYLGEYWPTLGWRSCAPEEVGMSSAKLVAVYEYAADRRLNTEGLLIIRDGYIVAEAYFGDFTATQRHYSYSVAKSFASAVIGIAIDQGDLNGIGDLVYQFYPQWQQPGTDPRKQQITIRHLLTMSSGLQWNEDDYYGNTSQNDAYKMYGSTDVNQYVLDRPMANSPGAVWRYSSGDSQLFSGLIKSATGQSFYEYALPSLLEPIGLAAIGWDHDQMGTTHTGTGVRATLREYARFGFLYLNRGKWDTMQVVPESWVNESLEPVSSEIDFYGYQWWLKPALDGHRGSAIPDSTYLAWGIYTQQIYVIPEERMVIVRVGSDENPENYGWNEVTFLNRVMNAVDD